MKKAYLLLGGNTGEVIETFYYVLIELQKRLGSVTQWSPIYSSQPWGYQSKNLYYNQAVEIWTDQGPLEVLYQTQEIEHEFGRNRIGNDTETYQDRPIDIDILFYDKEVMFSKELSIPHPRVCDRRFVLKPLSDIAPNLIHPKENKSILDLLNICKDTNQPEEYACLSTSFNQY